LNPLILFATTNGPHISIKPESLFEIGGITITNSMFYGWISTVLIGGLLIFAARRMKLHVSKGPLQVIDAGAEFVISNMMVNILGSRQRAVKYAPIFMTIFFYIMLNNWLGLLPGVGSVQYDGNPLLRPFTADLNGTLSMAIVGMVIVQIISIKENGAKHHIRHYFAGKLWNPATYLVGAFEVFTEFTRLLALGLRLFANIAIGEILIGIFAYLGGIIGPVTALPFLLVELFVGALQAYIFVILCLAYLSLTTTDVMPHESEHNETEPEPAK
jgi:F-type H+-transporting ATPase subunit a